jgi:predicted RNase H-like HicB family nuclease
VLKSAIGRLALVKEDFMEQKYTAIIRKSRLEYVAVCLELNVSARGDDLPDVERNLKAANELYLEDLKEHPETARSSIPIDELIEFLRDTEPDWYRKPVEGLILRPFEFHEVPSYACIESPRCPARNWHGCWKKAEQCSCGRDQQIMNTAGVSLNTNRKDHGVMHVAKAS